MQTSKTTLLKALLGLYALSLAGCNLPSPQQPKSSEESKVATFTAQAMAEKSKALEVSVQGAFALPGSKIFNLQACIKDRSYDKSVAGHEFLIEEAQQTVSTDKAGCLTWAESISYNFLADSQYIRLERTIKGTGLHKGSQKVSFAINPWSHGENLAPVLNPNDGNIPHLINDSEEGKLALKGLSAEKGQSRRRNLWVEDGRLFITEQKITKDGVNLLVEMRPNVSIQLTKMNGELFPRPLTSGTFKARMNLIHIYQQDNHEVRRQLAISEVMNVRMENGSLAIKSLLSLPALPTRGQIMLGLELQPEAAPHGLVGFDGIYLLGEYDQIKGSSFLKLNTLVAQTSDFKITAYVNADIKDVTQITDGGALSQDTYQKPKIEVSQLEFRFVRVGQETTSHREIIYNIKACVRSGVDQKNTRAHTFKVTKFRQSEDDRSASINLKTDNNSCLNWDESITFKYFDCQRNLKGHIKIENSDLSMNEKLDILVNPWESSGVLARDLRYVDPTEKIALSCTQESRPRSQLLLDGFSYNTLSYSYDVDESLNLTVSKKIQFKMDPRLLIYSSLGNGRGEAQRMRDGVYLLKLAIVQNRDYDQSNAYVASADRLVNVLNGSINTDITLQTQDLKALGNRNNILVELHPVKESAIQLENGEYSLKDKSQSLDTAIDQDSVLDNPTHIGPITLNIDESSRPLRILDASSISSFLLDGKAPKNSLQKFTISDIVTKGLAVQADMKAKIKARSQSQQFAKDNNLDLISLAHADEKAPLAKALIGKSNLNERLQISKQELQSLLASGTLAPQTAQKLCAFWASDYMKKMHASKGGALAASIINPLGMDCYNTVKKNPSKFFLAEKQMLVKELGQVQYIKGLNQGLSVGTSFSLSASHSKSFTRSASVSAKLGLTKKFLDVLSVGVDLGYSMSWSTSDSNTASNSVSVSGSTSMSVQQNIFKIRVNKHEQCMILRLNPKLFIKDTQSWILRDDYLGSLNSRLSGEEQAAAITRGIMICEGTVRNQPTDIIENYYLIAQESSSAQMQDNGDARNRNFFIALRSTKDFNRFVVAMRGSSQMPEGADTEEDPQVKATRMMEQLFMMPSPATPGMFHMN